jgi:hypothetical protein
MGERVTISYRGTAYELGQGRHSYGIWAVGALGEPRGEPVERWPETPEGWNAAWSRFTGLETPASIVAARSRRGLSVSVSASAAAALLTIGVLCGVVGLFPSYLSGASLASQPAQLVPHVLYLAAWTLSAVLIVLGGSRRRAGALLGLGTSIVTFGFFLTDVGEVIAYGGHLMGAGLWLGLIGWLACAAGSVLACLIRPSVPARPAGPAVSAGSFGLGGLGRPRGYEIARAALLILAGLAAAVMFAPSWDSYLLRTATGGSESITAGNAFSNPGAMIAGNLAVMIAFGLVVVVAALWRPVRLGALLLAGAVIPMAAQAISALIGVGEATSPGQFGFSSSQATQIGLTISNGVTVAFWVFSVLIVVLLVSCAWMLITPPAALTPAAADAPSAPAAWDDEDDSTGWDAEDDSDEADDATEAHDSAGAPDAGKAVGTWP